MSKKITDVIKPFVTKLDPEKPENLDLRKSTGGGNGYQPHTIYIIDGTAEIYNDGTHTIKVPIWGYSKHPQRGTAQYPGPSIIVSKNQTVHISWENGLTDEDHLPCPAIQSDYNKGKDETPVVPQNVLGVEDNVCTTMGHNAKGRFSTHLHGGKVAPHSDGWPETMLRPGQNHLSTYENKQRATLLWYHDHAMHTTRLHAYAGIAAAWIISDKEEDKLQLPENWLPLIIQDRNLTFSDKKDTVNPSDHRKYHDPVFDSDDGIFKLHARFLHKVEGYDHPPKDDPDNPNPPDHGPLEFAGPLTLVNGKIWPFTKVKADWYRLRILNGSNSRTYRLQFAELLGDGSYQSLDVQPEIVQIGSDGGFLEKPAPLTEGLILSPAERADVLVNFKSFEGRDIVLLNIADAPFAGGTIINSVDDNISGIKEALIRVNAPVADQPETHFNPETDESRTPYPQVMMFKVNKTKKPPIPSYDISKLDLSKAHPSFAEEGPDLNKIAKTRTVAIVEKETTNGPILVLWELQKLDDFKDGYDPILNTNKTIKVKETVDGGEVEVKYAVIAERFQDPVSYMVEYGTTEKWRFINLTADTHPMHMHLVQFQGQARKGIFSIKPEAPIADEGLLDKIISDWDSKDINANNTVRTALSGGNEVEFNLPGVGDLILSLTSNLKTGYTISIDGDRVLHENEQGLKDTIRVNPGEMVEVAAKFDGYLGRYVYHCHLLEHEDHDMMRQFVVTRNDLGHDMSGMGGGGMHPKVPPCGGHSDMPVISVGSKKA